MTHTEGTSSPLKEIEIEIKLRDGGKRKYKATVHHGRLTAKIKFKSSEGRMKLEGADAALLIEGLLARISPSPAVPQPDLTAAVLAALDLDESAIAKLEVECEFADGTEIEYKIKPGDKGEGDEDDEDDEDEDDEDEDDEDEDDEDEDDEDEDDEDEDDEDEDDGDEDDGDEDDGDKKTETPKSGGSAEKKMEGRPTGQGAEGGNRAARGSPAELQQDWPDALALLHKEHTVIRRLMERIRGLEGLRAKKEAIPTLILEVNAHALLEEEVFYPALQSMLEDTRLLDESLHAHQGIDESVEALLAMDLDEPAFAESLEVLCRILRQHLDMEEQEVFPAVLASGVDLTDLAVRLRTWQSTYLAKQARHGGSLPGSRGR